MHRRRTCRRRQSDARSHASSRSRRWCRRRCSATLSSTLFIGTRESRNRGMAPPAGRQAGCMGKADKRRRTQRVPRDIMRAIAAAEDEKAFEIVLLDLRKAGGFADYFLVCSGGNPRQIRTIADAIVEAVA